MELILRTALILITNARRPVAAIAAAGLLLLCTGQALAQDLDVDSCPSSGTRPGRFASALSGDAFLTLDNEEVRLAGVLAPGSGEGGLPEAVVAASRAYLEQAIASKPLLLAFTGPERDRYGRLNAQVFVGGEWLQGMVLREGLARAAPDILTQVCASALLGAEALARSSGAGHWENGRFAVLQMEYLLANERRLAGSFQIVQGAIVEVGDFRGRYFLNFGEDRETDFTVTIAPPDMRIFRQSDIELSSLVGRQVRVRGWLESYNGPNLPISIPEAIEVIK